MKNIPTLVIIQLLTLLSCIQLKEGSDVKSCLKRDKNDNCICCKSGYRGKTCTTICQNCLSRISQGQSCTYYCKTGYFGQTCEKACPAKCGDGIRGPRFCEEKNGSPICATCIPGYYGKECVKLCDKSCLDRICDQTGGKCLNCINNMNHGDNCKDKCNKGCVSETCNRTGHCIEGCKYGFFGGKCDSECGKNCIGGKCTGHEHHTYKCTKGCLSGHKGIQCSEKCQHPCMECNQHSGDCTSCVEDYVINPEIKKCMKKESPVIIAVSLIYVGFIFVVVFIVTVIVWKIKQHNKRRTTQEQVPEFDQRDASGVALLSYINEEDLRSDTNGAAKPNAVIIIKEIKIIPSKLETASVQITWGSNCTDLTYKVTCRHVRTHDSNSAVEEVCINLTGCGVEVQGLRHSTLYKAVVTGTDPQRRIVTAEDEFTTGPKILCEEGVRNADLVDLQIQDIQDTFVETSIYNLVKAKLKTNGHVTISGASGEGKTSMALMLGNDYKKKGYQLVFVTNPIKFNMNIIKGRKTFCIFDDIFGAERQSDTSKLKEVLLFVELYLKKAKSTTDQTDAMKDFESTNRQQNEELNFMVVFTSKTYNLTSGMSKIPECKHFMNSSVVDVTDVNGYSQSDMEQIFLNHKQMNNINENMPIEQIFKLKMLTFGFPLLCMMYFQLLHSKGIDALSFFREPIAFLESEMKSIIKSKNEQSAALILMMLCEDGLNVFHLEYESDDTVLEQRVKKVLNLMKSIKKSRIAEAVRFFQGTYFTKGDIMYFSHPAITDACAFVIFDIYPQFLLRNGSMKFLYERIHPVLSDLTIRDWENNTLLISQTNYDVITERFVEVIKKGEYSMTISHPILQNKDVVDNLFKKLNFPPVYFHERYNHKCFLHWAVRAKSLYLIQKILQIDTNFSPEEIQQACEACATFGDTLILNLLFKNLASQITETVVINVALAVAYTGNSEMFECLPLNGQIPKLSLSLTSQGHNMMHAACIGGNTRIVERVSQWINIDSQDQHGQTAIMLATISGMEEVVTFLNINGANLAHTDKKGNTAFHLACQVGKICIVQYLLPLCDINSRGENGWTPAMVAAFNGKKEVFDLLVTKVADLTLTDNYGNTVLHLACQGGNTSIVEYLLPLFDINSRGQIGGTPAMIAACSGEKEAFDLLVTKEADLTLTDNNGNSVLHHACWGGNTSIVEHLLPSFDINSRGQNDDTPIMIAAVNGKKEVFDLLVTKEADLTLTDNYGNTVLHLACQGGNTSIVEYLLPLFDINSRGQIGGTPAMIAACSGEKKAFDLLVTKEADLTLTDNYGSTVLHLACQGGNTSIVEYLLPLFDINSQGENGWTPVMNAAYSGKKEVFDLLVANGAVLTLADSIGFNILHRACTGGNIDIVRHTLPLYDVNVKGWNSHTPLMRAVCGGHIDVVDLLMSNKADVNLVDGDGDSLLHLACESGNLAMLKHVFRFSDINLRDKLGWTPLMQSAVRGHLAVFQYLVDKGASMKLVDNVEDDVLTLAYRGGCKDIIQQLTPYGKEIQTIEKWTRLMYHVALGHWPILKKKQYDSHALLQRDGFGDTLLHLACRGGNLQCVEYLLPSYDINVRGRYEWTPVMMAARCGHMDVLQCLISYEADLSLVSDTGEDVLCLARRGTNTGMVTFLLTLPDFSDTG